MSAPHTGTARPSMDSSTVLSPIISPSASYVDLSVYNPPASRSLRQRRRRESTASSIHSLTSSIGTVVDWKSPNEYGTSAISTLLENPSSRSQPQRPTTRDIPTVTLTAIPKVKASEFASYLSISAEYEKYLRAKDLGLEEHPRLSKTDSPGGTPSQSFVDLVESKLSRAVNQQDSQHDRIQNPARLNSTPPTPLDDGNKAKRYNIAPTPLSTVPSVYFDDNFRLENPRTFDVVSERSDVIRPTGYPGDDGSTAGGINGSAVGTGRKALATNAILQEKLSWYMDTVEVHLISSISQASSSFFAALGDLRELHSETVASVEKIQSLRRELVDLDNTQAIKGLEIVRLRKRRNNVAKLEGAVKQIEILLEHVNVAGSELDKGNVEAALDGVDSAENLLLGKPPLGGMSNIEIPALIDLRQVKALDAVSSEINHLRLGVGKFYEDRFVDTLLADLRNHVEKVPPTETLRRWCQSFQREQGRPRSQVFGANGAPIHPPRSSSLLPEYTTLSESLRKTLSRHLDGLKRARSINSAISAYRDAVLRETKNLIRRNMPSSDDDSSIMSNMTLRSRGGGRSTQERGSRLAQALRNLGPIEAEDLLFRCYCGISELVRRLGSQQKLLLDLTSGMGEMGVGGMLSPRLVQNGFNNGSSGKSSGPEDYITAGISDLISPALDIAQAKLLTILKARNQISVKFGYVDFLRYFTLNRLFFSECEAVSGRVGGSGPLQSFIWGQTKDFVQAYHTERTRILAEILEKDKWAAKDFDETAQENLNRLLDAATKDPEIWLRHTKIFEDTRETVSYGTDATQVKSTPTDSTTPAKIRPAVVDEQDFILPNSSLKVLEEVDRYESLMVMLPGITPEVATSMLEFLKVFNSRTCQLILGAGATMSAGLKNITTKHLALASQGLSVIITLMPYLRECARRHAGANAPAVMAEFDKVKRAYQEHQEEIHNKLVSIMGDRLSGHIRNFPSIDWESSPSKPNTYMETLVKETTTLDRVLSKHLSPQTLLSIMTPVFNIYKDKLMEAYSSVELRSEDAKAKMLKDAELFKDRLSKLEGCGTTAEIIYEMVSGKQVVSTRPPP